MNKKYTVPAIADDNLVYFGQRVELYFASAMVAGGMTDKKLLKRGYF